MNVTLNPNVGLKPAGAVMNSPDEGRTAVGRAKRNHSTRAGKAGVSAHRSDTAHDKHKANKMNATEIIRKSPTEKVKIGGSSLAWKADDIKAVGAHLDFLGHKVDSNDIFSLLTVDVAKPHEWNASAKASTINLADVKSLVDGAHVATHNAKESLFFKELKAITDKTDYADAAKAEQYKQAIADVVEKFASVHNKPVYDAVKAGTEIDEELGKIAKSLGVLRAKTDNDIAKQYGFEIKGGGGGHEHLTKDGVKALLTEWGVLTSEGKFNFKATWQAWTGAITGTIALVFSAFNFFSISNLSNLLAQAKTQFMNTISQLVPVIQQLADQNAQMAQVLTTLKASRDKLATLMVSLSDSIVNNLSPAPMRITPASGMNSARSMYSSYSASTVNADASTATSNPDDDDNKKRAQQGGAPSDAQVAASVKHAQEVLAVNRNNAQNNIVPFSRGSGGDSQTSTTQAAVPAASLSPDILSAIQAAVNNAFARAGGQGNATPQNPNVYYLPSGAMGQAPTPVVMPIRQG